MFTSLSPTFLGQPQLSIEDVQPGDLVILGVCEATPYTPGQTSHAAGGPSAVRQALAKYAGWTGHYDFDFGAPVIGGGGRRIVDIGNLDGDPGAPEENRTRITAAVAQILGAGATPLVIGGDDSVPIPLLAAYEAQDPFHLVQIDAHLDWRHERKGVTMGWSSPMRRASQMAWVEGIVQAGLRGPGSARPEDVRDAQRYGASIFTARDIHTHGVGPVAEAVPQGSRCFITIDCDGLDPGVIPAVLSPVPGGLTYWQVVELIETLSERAEIIGFDLVELVPERDLNGVGALTAGRIICNLCAALSRARSR
ncbi:N(1)-aminopropylagmatine ureohydrolase [bacterium BMS3Bbin10]|nr:N(1)-aminopropylagmatine ureohydrolase [bacterium BMS3Bbin10]